MPCIQAPVLRSVQGLSTRIRPLAAALCLALLAPLTARAQPAPMAPPPGPLYQAFGQRAGLDALAADFVERLSRDARTAPFFEKTNRPELAGKLADQFCTVLQGPCEYQGADMKTAHQDMDIRKQDFNALVEVLQQAMDARGIAFADQNRLLARLAPMHRDVITLP